MIELEKTCIFSSMESQIAEMIGRDEQGNDYLFYLMFSALVFDKKKKELRFPTLREFWNSGDVIKRYLEYPCETHTTMKYVWELLSEYPSKGSYIVNFVTEKKVYEDIILFVSIEEKKRLVTIRFKQLTGDIVEQTLLFEEYVDDFLSESIEKQMLRFDVFDIAKQASRFDKNKLLRNWENAKLGFWEQKKCMKKATDIEKVLSEWFAIFQSAVLYFTEKGIMNHTPLVQSDYALFSYKSKDLKKKLKRYSELLSNAQMYVTGEEE